MIKVLICGVCGKMGANIYELLRGDEQAVAVCGVDPQAASCSSVPAFRSFDEVNVDVDVVIDFSSPAALEEELKYALSHNVPLVLASTGYTPRQLKDIENAAKRVAIFRTANFSLGINLICELVKRAAQTLGENFDVEIVEKHHNQKVDAPSGTAIMLADSVNSAFSQSKQILNGRNGIIGKRGKEIGMHAVRGGTIVGEHEVAFYGEDEIITISHSARSKKVFAAGAIKAAKWLYGKSSGLYDMSDLLADKN